jgi:3-oxoacyl-[acyl-carrier protein] reductase
MPAIAANAVKPIAGAVALVTGASRGIGFAIAEKLGSMGARVALCARDSVKLSNAEQRLRSANIDALSLVADVRRQSEIDALLEKTRTTFGPIDILVNNAGIATFGPFHQQQETDWDAILDTNLKAVFLLSRAVAPEMIRRGTGHIINIASLAGKNAFAGGGIYCASKWGLLGLTGCMAEDLRGFGIRVSAVCPGSVATDFSTHAGKDPARMLQPEDVAHAVGVLITQAPQSFISEIQMRPTKKP